MTYLIQLLKEYANNDKLADQEFVVLALNYLIKENNLYGVINYIEFNNNKNTSFNDIEKKINFDIQMNINFILKQFEPIMKKNSSKTNTLILNLNVLANIFHEVAHAIQFKNLNNHKSSLESYLVYISFEWSNYKTDLYNKRNSNYQKKYQNYLNKVTNCYTKLLSFYFCNPAERIAYINSYQKVLDIIDQMNNSSLDLVKDIFTIIHKLYQLQYYRQKILKIEYPFKIYMNSKKKFLRKCSLCTTNYYKQFIDKSKNLSLQNRLLYGMPISNLEYQNQLEELQSNLVYQLRRV